MAISAIPRNIVGSYKQDEIAADSCPMCHAPSSFAEIPLPCYRREMSAFDRIKNRLRLIGRGQGAAPTTAEGISTSRKPYTIEQAWTEHFAPVVRAEGFKGSGRNYRLVTDVFALAVNLQGSRYGGKFTVNLGVHPMSIPNVTGKMIDLKKFKEIECAFRERLTVDGHDTWWSYGDNASSMAEAAKDAAALFRALAMIRFNERMNFVRTASPEDVGRASPIVLACFARMRDAQGEIQQARQFASMARKTADPSWITPTSIKHLLDHSE